MFRDLSGARSCVAGRNDRGVIKIRLRSIDRRLVGIGRSDDLIGPGLQLGRPAAGSQKPSRPECETAGSPSSRKQVGHHLSSFGPSPDPTPLGGDGVDLGQLVALTVRRLEEVNNVKALSVYQWLERSDGLGSRSGRMIFLFLRRNLGRSIWAFCAKSPWLQFGHG
jgi:hypothetical protein